ncbi:MAG: hypothetical protein LBT42_01135 [Tannerella sp.]|jgi:hypothetical protein|nr:hypothetical protein [Tannerella sp.]
MTKKTLRLPSALVVYACRPRLSSLRGTKQSSKTERWIAPQARNDVSYSVMSTEATKERSGDIC